MVEQQLPEELGAMIAALGIFLFGLASALTFYATPIDWISVLVWLMIFLAISAIVASIATRVLLGRRPTGPQAYQSSAIVIALITAKLALTLALALALILCAFSYFAGAPWRAATLQAVILLAVIGASWSIFVSLYFRLKWLIRRSYS